MRRAVDVSNARQGHIATVNLWQHEIKPWTSTGGAGRLTWEPVDLETKAGMRRYFHGFVVPAFVDSTGYGANEAKRVLVQHFCPPQFNEDGTEVDEKSTEALSVHQYGQFIHEVQAFGACYLEMTFVEAPRLPASRAAPSAAQP